MFGVLHSGRSYASIWHNPAICMAGIIEGIRNVNNLYSDD